MYFNILKKDLKRKKTMNIILLLFTILASVFVSSGLSNVVNVLNGTEYFLEKAGIGDYIIITQSGDGGIKKILDESENVKGYRDEECLWASKDDVRVDGRELVVKNNTMVFQSVEAKGIKYFTLEDVELTKVNKGEIYVSSGFLKKNNAEIGSSLSLSLQGVSMSFKIAGEIKDALLGSDMMGNTRYIMSDEDYEIIRNAEELEPYRGDIYYIDSDNVRDLSQDLTEAKNMIFNGTRSMIKLCYVMDTIVAMIVLVLSICLIIVSFVLLKFVITFSIKEDFREIGVMKAIGIRNLKVRSLYITKYLFMAVIGAALGFFLGIPFGRMMLASVSSKMVLGNESGIILNLAGAIIVMLLIVAFAFLCTRIVKKCTPLDAIRSGQTGERFRKRTVYRMEKARTNSALYLAINDILSAPKRFITIIISFFLCSILVMGVVLVCDTMKSKNLITTFGKESDIYITDSALLKMDFMSEGGSNALKDKYKELEDKLSENGLSGKVSLEVWYKYNVTANGKKYSLTFQQNTETKTTDYIYTEGSAPLKVDEIAITKQIAEKIDAGLGDTIRVSFGDEDIDCTIVGYFQTMNQLGEVVRLHENAPTDMKYASALMAYQIDFTDNPSDKEIERRVDLVKEIFNVTNVFDAAGYCVDCIGVVPTMEAVSKLLLAITCIVVILVTVLMERSFISDETGQIALLKAIGFKDRVILKWHIVRFMLVSLIATGLAVVLTVPVTRLWCNPIWKMMGASAVKYAFNPVSLLIVIPGSILLITLLAVTLTALYMKSINSRNVMNIE